MTKIVEHTLPVGDLNIFYREMGEGRPIILLHGGWATGQLNWSPHYDKLAESYHVISPDHRGHGNTNNPGEGFTTYGKLAWEIISFIERLDLPQKPIVIGHSSGAVISLHMSIFQPDLLAAQVLVGIHPAIGVADVFKRGMEKFFNTNDYRNPPSKLKYFLNNPLWSLALWNAHNTPWFTLLRQAWPMWIKPLELTECDYKKITIPTLAINGNVDEFGDVKDAHDMCNEIAGAQMEIIDGANHMFVVDEPEKLQEILLPFLDKLP